MPQCVRKVALCETYISCQHIEFFQVKTISIYEVAIVINQLSLLVLTIFRNLNLCNISDMLALFLSKIFWDLIDRHLSISWPHWWQKCFSLETPIRQLGHIFMAFYFSILYSQNLNSQVTVNEYVVNNKKMSWITN